MFSSNWYLVGSAKTLGKVWRDRVETNTEFINEESKSNVKKIIIRYENIL